MANDRLTYSHHAIPLTPSSDIAAGVILGHTRRLILRCFAEQRVSADWKSSGDVHHCRMLAGSLAALQVWISWPLLLYASPLCKASLHEII
jgi:hypothetical protein